MLKFVTEGDGPTLIGLGLSSENLALLRGGEAIQFHGADVGLGDGVFVIAHGDDPRAAEYEGKVGEEVCELLTLDEQACGALGRGEVLRRPLRGKRSGHDCEAAVFSLVGTEEETVAAMRERGLIGPQTRIREVETAAAPRRAVATHGPDPWGLLKLGGGAAVMAALAIGMAFGSRGGPATLLLGLTSAVMLVMFLGRRGERVEIDAEELRRKGSWGDFTLAWRELAALRSQDDSLGPFALHLETRDGTKYTLERRYADWDELVQRVIARASAPPPRAAPAGPRVAAHGDDAAPAGHFVKKLPGGTRIVDLRSAGAAELDLAALFERIEEELRAAGASSELVVWVIEDRVAAAWSEDLLAFADKFGGFSIARTESGKPVANALVMAGPCEDAAALSTILQSFGVQLFKIGAADPLPVLEAKLRDGRIVPGMTGTPVGSL